MAPTGSLEESDFVGVYLFMYGGESMNIQIEKALQYLVIAVFSVLGALARQEIEILIHPLAGSGFPLATLLINLTGAFFLSWFYTLTIARSRFPQWLRTGIGTGFVGSYTTFSTFMVESETLLSHGSILVALFYLFISFVGGFALALLGVRLAHRYTAPKTASEEGECAR